MKPIRESRPAANRAASSSRNPQSTASADTDFDFDRRVVDSVDRSIWAALFNGDFRLAVRCEVCGRWLTDGRSRRDHRGPVCRDRAGVR
jgi:hypothetical protein